jgi:hypothetical protein
VTAVGVVGPNGVSAASMLFPSSELSSNRDAYGEPAYRTKPVPRDENMKLFADSAVELLLAQLLVNEASPPPPSPLSREDPAAAPPSAAAGAGAAAAAACGAQGGTGGRRQPGDDLED